MHTHPRAVRVPALRRPAGFVALLVVSLFGITCSKSPAGPPAGATQLAFFTQPSNATAAADIAPAVVVEARDAAGALVADFTGSITLSISTNPASGTLSGATSANAVAGRATFTDLSINRAGTGYRLDATSGSLTKATSAAFDIVPGLASQLAFTQQPSTTGAGVTMGPAIAVAVQDAEGNTVTGFSGNIVLAIVSGTGTAGAALSGTTSLAPASGVATFSNLSIDKVGNGYQFSAKASGLPDATSSAFDIVPGPAKDLIITVQPGNTTAGVFIAPALQVTAHDGVGNIATGFTGLVSVAITSGTGALGASLQGLTSKTATGGVANFGDLHIDKAGSGYTLDVSAAGVTGATSAPFSIAVGAASQLAFTVQPSTGFAGVPLTPAVQVSVQDAVGNLVTSASGSVQMALGANPGGSTLSGTTSRAIVAGVATFSDLSLDKAGLGYTLTAANGSLSGATSDPFNTIAGAGANLVFSVQPTSAVAGTGIAPAVQVTVKDGFGNVATGFNGSVTIALANNAGGGTLSGATTVSANAGVATFTGLNIDKVGTAYTLSAGVTGLPGITSNPFNITPGTATQLVYSSQPSTATAGVVIAPAVVVTALDAMGNVATGFSGSVAVAISLGTGTPGAVLSGAISLTASSGVATFNTLNINRSGTGYTLAATSLGLSSATSAPFDINAAAPTHLVYTVQPTDAFGATAIAPAVTVQARDNFENLATGFSGNVVVAISGGTGTAGAVLSGATSVPAVGGVASFPTLSIDKAGTGYTLAASATSLLGATSSPFAILVGSVSKLAFTVEPATTTAGQTIAPAVKVAAQDNAGNTVTSFASSVTLAIGTNPSGGTLSGNLTATPSAGVATFSDLSIEKSGVGYTLTAAASGTAGATSVAFNINAGVATHLTFSVQPSAVAGGVAISPAVEVTALDAVGNTATGFTDTVLVAISNNPSAANLSGTVKVKAAAGIATFSNLKLDKAGTGYTLAASATGLTGVTSSPFDVTIGAPAKLAFTVQPPATDTAGTVLTPTIQVVAQDAAGNIVPNFTDPVSVAITSGTGTSGAILSGTTTVGAVGGTASFSTLSIDKSGTGYKLTATSGTLTAATSTAFAITPGPLAKLGFTVQPATAKAGATISPTIKVAGQDLLGNTITTFTSNVTIAIGTNPATPIPGTLSGTLIVKASSGVASFSTLKIDKVGTGYTLVASATGVLSATSLPFNITPGNATQLVFTAQPLSSTALVNMPPVVVTALDAFGNVATGFSSNIVMALGTVPTLGAALRGTTTVKASSGVSTFSTLSIDSVGNGYTLVASSTGLTGATSASFDITNGSKLVFTVQPSAVNAGATITPAVQVTAKDPSNVTVTAFTGPVTVAILGGSGTAGAILSGTKTVNAVNGVATFPNLSINLGGTGYKLTASSSGFSSGTSNAFTVTSVVGAATKLGFITQPTNTPAGSTIVPGPVVAVQDALGNTVKGLVGTITVAIGTNPSGGLLSGTTTVNINAGVGNFPNLSIDKVGNGYTLAATTSLGLTPATSTPFNITAAATVHLAFTVQPSATTAGLAITPAVQVSALNASNAVVTSFTGPVTIAIAAGTGANGATLGGTLTANAVNGVATFSNLIITKAGTGYKLTASSPGTAAATSASFTINPDVAVTLHFAIQPTTGTHGTIITPAVEVDARDQYNNVVKSFAGSVTVAITAGTGTAGAILSGTKTVAATAGVAVFSNLSIDKVGTGYKLTATTTGLLSDTSASFSEN